MVPDLQNKIIPLNKLGFAVNILYVLGLFGGSLFYFVSTALSLQNILLFPTLIVNLLIIRHRVFPKKFLYPIFFLSSYLIIITISSILTSTEDAFKGLLYQYHLICIFLIPLAWPNFSKIIGVKIAKFFLIFWFVWAIMQIAVLLQILPSGFNFLFSRNDKIDSQYGAIQISGPFSNSNDFGCLVLLILLFILYFSDRILKNKVFFYLAGLDIIMAMSRTALVLYVLLLPAFLWINGQIKKLIKRMVLFLILMGGLLYSINAWQDSTEDFLYNQFGTNAITINFNRLMSIVDFIVNPSHKEHSASYRSATYEYAISKMPYQIFGLGYQNYEEFYKEGNFEDHLVWVNPHSFLIEIGVAYGLPALLSFLLFLFSVTYYVLKAKKNKADKRFIILIIIYTIILSNIPSSIILLPIFWLPMMMVYSQTLVENDKSLSSYKRSSC